MAEASVGYVHDDRSKVRIPSTSLTMARDLMRLAWEHWRHGRVGSGSG